MSLKDINELDLKLILQSGQSIFVENLEIKPFTLQEIVSTGYSQYMQKIQWISLTIDDFIEAIDDGMKKSILSEQRENLRTLDFYTKLGGQEMLEGLLLSLSMIFRTTDIRLMEDGVIAINFQKMGIYYIDEDGEMIVNDEVLATIGEDDLLLIHRDNFDEIVDAIKLQNFLKKPEEAKEEKYADEETRLLMEKMKRDAERVEKLKKKGQEDEPIDLADIISAVSSKSYSLNELNIWQLTLYQLYQKYSRLELIDNYDFSVKAMMAGAENIDLKHWSSKL